MRRISLPLIPVMLAVPALMTLPVSALVAGPSAPKPVAPSVRSLAVAGVNSQALALAATEVKAAAVPPGRVRSDDEPGLPNAGVRTVVMTPMLRSKTSFETYGVTWDAGQSLPAGLTVWARTTSASGVSDWSKLAVEAGDATASSGQRPGTAAFWSGPSTGVQIRVDVAAGAQGPRGVRAELVDPGTSDYDAYAGTQRPEAASAMYGRPSILTRAQWGADESRVRSEPTIMSTVQAGVIHHTDGNNGYSSEQVPGIIRGDYAYHLSRGWNDLGYNFVVDRFGRIWEGRAGGIGLAVMGAHSGGFNSNTFGVALLGNYDSATPSSAAVQAMTRIMAYKLDLYHRDPQGTTRLTSSGGGTARYPAGTTVTKPVIMGHRDLGYTDCPGSNLYPRLSWIRAKTASLMGAVLAEPWGVPDSVAYGQSLSMSARTGVLAQSWALTARKICAPQTVATIKGSAPARTRFTATWDGRAGSAPARPGEYRLSLTSQGSGSLARPTFDDTTIEPPPPAAAPAAVAATGAGSFVPVTPVRLLDTRSGAVLPAGAAGRIDLGVLGRGGVPTSGVTSVVLNVTAVCATTSTVWSAWPAGAARPSTALLNVEARRTQPALAVVPVGGAGKISLGNLYGVSDVVVDVVGYHTTGTGAALRPVAATRVYDSATDPAGAPASGEARTIVLPTLAGVSASSVQGVVANVSVSGSPGPGAMTVYPYGDSLPFTSSLNFGADAATQNRVVTGSRNGRLVIYPRGTAGRITVDVVGVYAAAPIVGDRFTGVTGRRLLDTRLSGGPVLNGVTRGVVVAGAAGIPADATAVLLNLAAVAPSSGTSITVYPAGGSVPAVPDLQIAAGEVRANAVLVPVGAGGAIAVRSVGASTNLVLDVIGYYS